MMLKTGASVAVLTLLLGVNTAMAQTPPPPAQRPSTPPAATEVPKAPVPGQILVQDANTILAKELIGQTVYAPDKAKIGSISDLILSKDGRTVEGFVIGVGGFLGMGEKSVAMKLDRLKMTTDTDADGRLQLTMDVKKEELTNTPTFKSKKDQDAEKAAEQRRSETPAQRPMPGTTK
jgi:sporulation protein YlmC with PRC-barrel domain